MRISVKASGSFAKIEKFTKTMSQADIFRQLEGIGQDGVKALSSATPKDSGETANAWNVKVKSSRGRFTMEWTNGNVVNGVPIAIILQYGHGTGTGGYVQGRDYINPAMKPIFDKLAERAWKVVTSA